MGKQSGEGTDESSERTQPDEFARREALKKAAAAGAVGGAIWAGPRIAGLSITPDYASAGTGVVSSLCFVLNGNGDYLLGGNNWMNVAANPQYTISTNGPSDDQAIKIIAPLPSPNPASPIGTATFNMAKGVDTDGPAVSGTVVFEVDPPFNKCQITSVSSDWTGSTNGDVGGSGSFGPNVVPNNVSSITVPWTVSNPGGPYFNPTTRLDTITVCIECKS